MPIIEWIKHFFRKEEVFFPGVLGDPNDLGSTHAFEEVVGASAPPVFVEKSPKEWRRFPIQYQFSSSSCVLFTLAKIACILFYLETKRIVKFSAGLYRRRPNYPQPGTSFDGAVSIGAHGIPTEEVLPSENLTEVQMNTLEIPEYADKSADAFAIDPNWVNVPLNFDTVAATIQKTGKGMMMWFEFGKGEFFGQHIPVHKFVPQIYRHSVTGSDVTLLNGKEYIVIEDSADVDEKYDHQKLISQEFFNKHCFLARYPIRFKYAKGEHKPIYDGSIASLQDCLEHEGLFPLGLPRGYFGDITREAVVKFQAKYGLEQVGAVGPKTAAKLKELYS